jgi:SAM-dependent methyltransferase
MGIPLYTLDEMSERGLLPAGARVLDIGSSNLYQAPEAGLRQFFARYGIEPDPAFIDRIAKGSTYGAGGIANESFVGELLERAGLSYRSFDIANGYKTDIFDLNGMSVPRNLVGHFDTVLNFGTTEHVMNQYNAMRVIHDAVRTGGHIVHEVPSLGFIDHGYIAYTPRFFFDLAGYNEYEVVDFAYRGPAQGKPIMNIVHDYKQHFPALGRYAPIPEVGGYTATDFAIYITYRKVKDMPFRSPMETSTSVGEIRIPSLTASVSKTMSLARRIGGRIRRAIS